MEQELEAPQRLQVAAAAAAALAARLARWERLCEELHCLRGGLKLEEKALLQNSGLGPK